MEAATIRIIGLRTDIIVLALDVGVAGAAITKQQLWLRSWRDA